MFIPAWLGLMIGGIPVFILLVLVLPFIKRIFDSFQIQVSLTICLCGASSLLYGIVLTGFSIRLEHGGRISWSSGIKFTFGITGVLFTGSLITLGLSQKQLQEYFKGNTHSSLSNQQLYMEPTNYAGNQNPEIKSNRSNRILIKGAVTAALIGIMMIPTVYITELVRERQSNQEAVVKEVNSRWSEAQTLTGPYIYLPYKVTGVDAAGKSI